MVINEEQAEVVHWMFSETLADKGSYRIATALNEKGVPTKKNGRWTAFTVHGILRNEKYTGDILFQKIYTAASLTGIQTGAKRICITWKATTRRL